MTRHSVPFGLLLPGLLASSLAFALPAFAEVAPASMGAGLGRALLVAGEVSLRDKHPQVTQVDAWVNADNPRSFQLFQHLGYSHRISRLEKEFA